MTDGENPAVDAAGRLAFDEIEHALIEEAAMRVDEPEAVDAIWTPDMPSESKVMDKGSFEKFRRSAK